MAVQHGYGKMAGTDALVFAYDTGDAVNSYKGMPTTNQATLNLENWINEGGTRNLQSDTFNGNPVYQWKSNDGQIWISPFAWNSIDLKNNDCTVSAYFKNISGNTETVGMYFGKDFSTDAAGNPNYRSIPVDGKWHRESWTMYADTNLSNYLEFRTSSSTMLITTPMVNYGRVAAQPVEGTRSVTEGLLDLTGNEIIDLSTVGFNSNGDIEFDATNDYISINNPTITAGPYTILMIVKPGTALTPGGSGTNKPTGSNRHTPLVGPGPVWNPGIWVTSDYIRSHADTQYVDSAINWTTGWQMIGMTYDGSNVKNILGGEVLPNTHVTTYDPSAPSELLLGAEKTGGSSNSWDGSIAVVNFYNRVLSPAEIQNNFNRYKTRFNIA